MYHFAYTIMETPLSCTSMSRGSLRNLPVTYMSPAAPEMLVICTMYTHQNAAPELKTKFSASKTAPSTITGASAMTIYGPRAK